MINIYIINKSFKDILCQFFSTYEFVDFSITIGAVDMELSKIIKYGKNLGRNVFEILINDIIYVYHICQGNKLISN